MKLTDCFKIASIAKTKGLKGEMQLYVATDDLDSIKFNAVFVDMAGKLIPYFVSAFKLAPKNTAYIYLEDVDTIEKATLLLKKDIYLPNKLKPKKKEAEFTLKDLVGFTAIEVDEGELGKITEINEYPQQLIATVLFRGYEVLFPLNEAIIQGIDEVKELVWVDLPEGLLDVYMD